MRDDPVSAETAVAAPGSSRARAEPLGKQLRERISWYRQAMRPIAEMPEDGDHGDPTRDYVLSGDLAGDAADDLEVARANIRALVADLQAAQHDRDVWKALAQGSHEAHEQTKAQLEQAEAALARLPSQPWQDIERAPKDGRRFLCFTEKTGVISTARWRQDSFQSVGREIHMRAYGSWSGWPLTHFMPLPEPPSPAAGVPHAEPADSERVVIPAKTVPVVIPTVKVTRRTRPAFYVEPEEAGADAGAPSLSPALKEK